MRFATVKEDRHIQLGGQRQLRVEGVLLLLVRGKVAVEIEAAFANRHHLRPLCQAPQRIGRLIRPFAGVMRMHARRRPAEVGLTLGQPLRLLALQRIGPGD